MYFLIVGFVLLQCLITILLGYANESRRSTYVIIASTCGVRLTYASVITFVRRDPGIRC
jgi:hypothetical protein